MVETIAPVVHGTRTWLISIALFAAGATSAAALLGLALGAALPFGGAAAAGIVAALAVAMAAGELGILHLPRLQMRRQVPERWRERYPQPVVALLYGAGLGVGFATYLPVATLLVVAVGVLALTGPLSGAAVLAAFGAGRALALAVATVRLTSYEQATGRIEVMGRLAGRRRLRLVNGAALTALGAVLALGAAAGSARASTLVDLGSDHVADPSAVPGALAFDRINSDGSLTGVIRYNGTFTDLPGFTPDVDGNDVVVDTGPGFEILDYTTMTVLRTLPLVGRDPALSGSWLVYRKRAPDGRQIVLYNLANDTSTVIARSRLRTDLGPPDISYPRVVYHRTGPKASEIVTYRIDTGASRVVKRTVVNSYFNPSIVGRQIVYVRQTIQQMQLLLLDLRRTRPTELAHVSKRSGRFLWTTGMSSDHIYFTIYTPTQSHIYRPG
jgi:hypothetical protein